MKGYIDKYLRETRSIIEKIDRVIDRIQEIKNSNGRMFFLGVRGQALKLSDACVLTLVMTPINITPHAGGWQRQMLFSHRIVNVIR